MENDDIEINLSSEFKKMLNAPSYKFLVLGDIQVGKTHILEVFTGTNFHFGEIWRKVEKSGEKWRKVEKSG